MEQSILTSTKKVLGVGADYTAFDQDILTHINATFGVLNQLGIGPANGFMIEDDTTEWAEYTTDLTMLGMVKSYIYLKVKMLFDPPTTSFHLDAANKQIEQLEWRLSVHREWLLDPVDPMA